MRQPRLPILYIRFLIALSLAAALTGAGTAAPVNTYTVTNTNNDGDGSLRWAIQQANLHVGPDVIDFAIPPGDPGCPGFCTIAPDSSLPPLSDNGTTINGYTQPGATPATATTPAVLYIELAGVDAGIANGLSIGGADMVITGLAIDRFVGNGIFISGAAATGNIIQGNHIGTSPGGTLDWGNTFSGVFIDSGASGNTVGGDEPSERNVLSGNGWDGVDIYGAGTDQNVISGNFIGIDADAAGKLENNFFGVRIYGGAKNNQVGGDTPGERNLISGNAQDGVRIIGVGSNGNIVFGNYIGTNKTGSSALGNNNGVFIGAGAQDNTIGGDATGESNLISGNLASGVVITGTNTMSNTVSYNRIGTDANSIVALGNGTFGLLISGGASYNRIGGDSAGERNLISGNDIGIRLEDLTTAYNVISGNFIGVTASGTAALGNHSAGIHIEEGAHHNRIGGVNATPDGVCSGECNLISGSVHDGIYFDGEGTDSNIVSGNYIGTDVNGTAPLPNLYGIELYSGASSNLIGGDTPGERNLISGNTHHGIYISDEESIDNLISGNYIGTDASGAADLGNGTHGIWMSGTEYNTVGGERAGEGNLISANGECGVTIFASREIDVFNNMIGLDASATTDLGNGSHGVLIEGGAVDVRIGSQNSAYGNLISGNQGDGVHIDDYSVSNYVWGNRIGLGADVGIDLGNAGNGVTITGGSAYNILDYGNLILYNSIGVMIHGEGVTYNEISSNRILYSDHHGVLIAEGATNNIIGPDNVIQDNSAYGVWITEATSIGNVVTQNSISSNSQGIKLDGGANNNMQAPGITSVELQPSGTRVIGKSSPARLVEIFGNKDDDGEGEVYLGVAVTDADGWFTLDTGFIVYPYLTATATNTTDGTSEFSAPFANPYRSVFLPIIVRP